MITRHYRRAIALALVTLSTSAICQAQNATNTIWLLNKGSHRSGRNGFPGQSVG